MIKVKIISTKAEEKFGRFSLLLITLYKGYKTVDNTNAPKIMPIKGTIRLKEVIPTIMINTKRKYFEYFLRSISINLDY